MVHRGYGNDAGSDAKLIERPGRFCNEATAYFIASGGEKWRQRQDVKCGLSLPGWRRDIVFGVHYL
jgi:hypothetical protein